ncbi:MAG: DNA polymerase III subunit delta [Clostridiales bacterium]|nr:DNA polymerase III subunit delta [Clostridiales bacterium]
MNTIKQHIKNNEYKNCYLIYGTEAYMKRLYKNKLKAAILSDSDDMNYTYAEGKDINVDEIIHIAETMPFFNDRRLILIENSGWFKSANTFADFLKEMPDTTYIVFVENEVDKRNRLFKAVKDKGYISEMNGLDEKNLKLWIASLLKRDEKKATEATVTYFLNKVGSNMDNIETELSKLMAYCYGRDIITNEDVDMVCSEQITGKMFVMLDSIASKNQTKALELYYDLITLREKPMTILYLLIRHMNILLQVKAYQEKRNDNVTIASKIGVPPFAVSKYLQQSKNFKNQVLLNAIKLGTEYEELVKTGRMIDQIAVEMLIIQIVAM